MDSDEERESETPTWRGVPGSVILINVHGNSRISAPVAHAAACRMVRQYLRASSSHLIGICLYGLEDSSTPSAFGTKNIVDVFNLGTPSLDDFQKLRNLKIEEHKTALDFQLSDVLWHCSKMFTNCKRQLSSRSVIMLTRLDEPPVAADQKPTLKRVVDLVDANIDIKIINIAQEHYKPDPFYETFVIEANRGNTVAKLPQPVWDDKEIERLMHQQSHRHLAVARLNFEIGEGISIGVGVYNLLIKSPHYTHKKINLDRETNATVSSITKTLKVTSEPANDFGSPMDVDGAENEPRQMPLLKSELLFYQEYGGERIEFTADEMKHLKNPFGPPMMKLLGFKPASLLCKEKWYLKSGYFLFPGEGLIEGSTVAFKAMHQACVETGMVAICVLCSRQNSKPNIVAICPCTHPLGLDVEIGFDVIQIPFVENVRDLPPIEEDEDECPVVSEEHRKLIKDMLVSLKFDYKPGMFENPKLQSEYRAVEAIALQEDDVDPFIDTTRNDPIKFEGLKEGLFEEIFGPFILAAKRPATSKTNGTSSKRAKGDELDESLLKERINCQTVHQYTVPQLKEILKEFYCSEMPALTGLKKRELVALVYEYCS